MQLQLFNTPCNQIGLDMAKDVLILDGLMSLQPDLPAGLQA
jgi:hypothetical protein